MKMRKKMLAMLLLSCMSLQALPVTASAAGMPDSSGLLLAEEVQKNQEAEINGLTITGNSATVNYQHNVAKALVIVAVYDSQTGQMFFSGNAEADKNKTSVTVTLNGTVPETYTARAFLLEQGTMRPLCPKYEITKKPAPEPDDGDDKILAAEPEETHIVTGTLTDENGSTYQCQYVNNQIIVSAADNATQEQISALVGKDGGKIVGYITKVGYYQIELSTTPGDADSLNKIIKRWKSSPLVEDAYFNMVIHHETDSTYPNDPWRNSSMCEFYPSGNNWGFEAIYAASAQQFLLNAYISILAVPRIKVGVIDSCFDDTHEDLAFKKIFAFNKLVDPQKVAQKAAKEKNLKKYKLYLHGTHVAGIIAAKTDNDIGISGVALNPELYGHELYEGGDSFTNYALTEFKKMTVISRMIEEHIKVINYSICDKGLANVEESADKMGKLLQAYLNSKDDSNEPYDFVIVTSAGNTNEHTATNNSCFNKISPADYPDVYKRIIVVGAAKLRDGANKYQESDRFSLEQGLSYGPRIDVVAPGINIYSTVPANHEYSKASSYRLASGTSMAAPHVAGVAALVYAANPDLTGDKVRSIIRETADIPVNNSDKNMVNAYAAVKSALSEYHNIPSLPQVDAGGNAWNLNSNGQLTITPKNSDAEIKPTVISPEEIIESKWYEEYKEKIEFYYYFDTEDIFIAYPWTRPLGDITSVKIDEGVASIGPRAFYLAANLTEVTLPESLTTIETEAFMACNSLNSITIPKSVKEIGKHALGYEAPGALTESFTIYGYATDENGNKSAAKQYADENNIPFVNLGDNIRYEFDEETGTLKFFGFGEMKNYTSHDIPPWVHEYGGKIKTVIIEDDITSIGNCTFYDCDGLTNITIPDSVTSIGLCAFERCSSLTHITIPESVTSIGWGVFLSCSSLTNITLPDSVTYISERAFEDCSSLTSITLPDSVTSIGQGAFLSCSSLTNITLPDSVTSIGAWVFCDCSSLSSITLPDSVTNIGYRVFCGCSSLTNITLPDSITSIDEGMFSGCSSLTNITLPDSVIGIGENAFDDCSSLKSITLPQSITYIGYRAFFRCNELEDIYYHGSRDDWNQISINQQYGTNDKLEEATIHYNWPA